MPFERINESANDGDAAGNTISQLNADALPCVSSKSRSSSSLLVFEPYERSATRSSVEGEKTEPLAGSSLRNALHDADMPRNCRRALILLTFLTLAFRLAWASVLETTNDESYHYLYTLHPDLSYFDHPPMTMWIAKAGLMLGGSNFKTLSLRLGFILLFVASTWVLACWTARWFGGWSGVYAAIAMNLTAYFPAAAGSFALPDGPLLFFSLLTMWALSEALFVHPGRTWPWLLVGIAWGGAMLSKYHAVFLPLATFLYIVVTPAARSLLRRPGPYLAVAIGLVEFTPVLIWNWQHGWASFVFQGGRALGTQFQPVGLLIMLFGPVAYLMPWIWFALGAILVRRLRLFRSLQGIERLLVCLAIVPLCFFFAVSTVRPILPHWPLISFVPLFPILGFKWWKTALEHPVRMRRRVLIMASVATAAAGVVAAQANFGFITFPNKDPSDEISGWESVEAELSRRGLLDDPKTFLFTPQWYNSSQLAYAIRNRVPVLCYSPGDARNFAFWSDPNEWIGHDGLLVVLDAREFDVDMYKPYFRRINKEADFTMTRSGKPFRAVHVYRCVDQRAPFPFQYGHVAPHSSGRSSLDSPIPQHITAPRFARRLP
jgi:hypothetical protein